MEIVSEFTDYLGLPAPICVSRRDRGNSKNLQSRCDHCGGRSVVSVFAQNTVADAASSPVVAPAISKANIRAEHRVTVKMVRQSLVNTKGLDTSKISVLARGETIVLTGSVKDAGQIQLAGDTAKAIAAGKVIDNRLTIAEPGN
ncbi:MULTISPECIES: BON domain-containing protein [unclassified Paraburkholderia]|uniref:BON domain-containing protein n=1 Tax=unclassified Paraburkholderia TaxID=2615204 RepID=UPI0016172D72|nr:MULTISPECIES: BON domain-containing protein [unclassified Paraburkholderia]MBB5447789.1 osmotically-inducible protein OsmY [Paraburkholderia sp. WSM4177]MBB5488274.1 osmotically-inducible protein OsmY [Paraburkholderia sp. WSM4180]